MRRQDPIPAAPQNRLPEAQPVWCCRRRRWLQYRFPPARCDAAVGLPVVARPVEPAALQVERVEALGGAAGGGMPQGAAWKSPTRMVGLENDTPEQLKKRSF
jgi:hypothetical protein